MKVVAGFDVPLSKEEGNTVANFRVETGQEDGNAGFYPFISLDEGKDFFVWLGELHGATEDCARLASPQSTAGRERL